MASEPAPSSSPSPDRGPDPSRRMSLAIIVNATVLQEKGVTYDQKVRNGIGKYGLNVSVALFESSCAWAIVGAMVGDKHIAAATIAKERKIRINIPNHAYNCKR